MVGTQASMEMYNLNQPSAGTPQLPTKTNFTKPTPKEESYSHKCTFRKEGLSMNITVLDWLDPERVLPVYDSASLHVPKQFATCSMQPIHQERSERGVWCSV